MPEPIVKRRENLSAVYSLEGSTVLYPVYESEYNYAVVVNNSLLKRLLDVVITLILFIAVFSWLMPLIALCIKLTSKGPVFFGQKRTGLHGSEILCYKFRTMDANASSVDHSGKYLQAVKNDPRITKIGAFLRKTSLDELPQFWNVLKGDMSIVGPRPHPKELDNECISHIENYHLRTAVKPGITGVAQVKGFRGGTPESVLMQERINHDIWYIKHWNIFIDIKVIILTASCIFAGHENAY